MSNSSLEHILNNTNLFIGETFTVSLILGFFVSLLLSIFYSFLQNKGSQNSSNLTHASTNDLHAEMIALKSLVVDQIFMLKKKYDEKQFFE